MTTKRTTPYDKAHGRNYGYDTAYESTPAQKENRAARNAARSTLSKEGRVSKGDGMDVDHKRPIASGGTNARDNLRAVPKSKNRGYPR